MRRRTVRVAIRVSLARPVHLNDTSLALPETLLWRICALLFVMSICLLPTGRSAVFAAAPQIVGNGTPASCTEQAVRTALAAGGSIRFDCGGAPHIITLSSELLINQDTDIDGGGLITLDGAGKVRVLRSIDGTNINNTITNVIDVRLANLTIANGLTNDQGGGLKLGFWNTLLVEQVSFVNNRATRDTAACDGGGAIFVGGGSSVEITDSSFSGNRANNGGAINNLRSRLTVRNSQFVDNHATHTDRINSFGDCGGGGAIYIDGGRSSEFGGPDALLVSTSRFEGNTTNNHGGAIFVGLYQGDSLLVERSVFEDNRVTRANSMASSGTGGAIWFGSATGTPQSIRLTVERSSFINNQATSQGGGIWVSAATTIRNATFVGNSANNSTISDVYDWRRGNGGALAVNNDAAVTIDNATFSANHSGFNGGAIAGGTSVTVRNSLFSANTGANGWGIQQHCTNPFAGTNNMQYPNRSTSNWNDYNCGTSANLQIVDPHLGTLADHGGNLPTVALLSNSPAINAGDPASCMALDQRGYMRNGRCDLGAFEFDGLPFVADHFVNIPLVQR